MKKFLVKYTCEMKVEYGVIVEANNEDELREKIDNHEVSADGESLLDDIVANGDFIGLYGGNGYDYPESSESFDIEEIDKPVVFQKWTDNNVIDADLNTNDYTEE